MEYKIYFYNYNNYYNRTIKKKDTIAEYNGPDDENVLKCLTDHNFDYADGIRTTKTLNFAEINGINQPNYCIVENKEDGSFTRWFVISEKKVRGGQYQYELKRDVIADYFDDIVKNSEFIIKKGYVKNDSVLAFNKEIQSYNKIKQNELSIKDKYGIGYVIGFISNDSYSGTTETSRTVKGNYKSDNETPLLTYSSVEDFNSRFSLAQYCSFSSAAPSRTWNYLTGYSLNIDNIQYRAHKTSTHYYAIDLTIMKYRNSQGSEANIKSSSSSLYNAAKASISTSGSSVAQAVGDYLIDRMSSTSYFKEIQKSYVGDNIPYDTYVETFKDKLIKIGGILYKVTFVEGDDQLIAQDKLILDSNSKQTILNKLYDITFPVFGTNSVSNWVKTETPSNDDMYYYPLTSRRYIKLTQQSTDISTVIPINTERTHLVDAPYDMFVIPYNDTKQYKVGGTYTFNANKDVAINIAQAICLGNKDDDSVVRPFDIQIVPYNPLSDCSLDGDIINFGANNYSLIKTSTSNVGAILWANRSSFNISIDETRIELNSRAKANKKKYTDLYQFRLCSPDASSQWEFNPSMNDGIEEWKIACDYRPYSSYIRIQPKWNYLYGSMSEDIRGLIYNGNYSLTQLSDSWANYVASNKNYQAIFDTQINTQLKTNELQNQAAWDTMFMRSYNVNPIQAIGSTWGNVKEQEMNEALQNISISSQKQLFNLQLDNIKSNPSTISKLTSINSDFRIFPFVEWYTCSKEEETIYDNMIKYNGMTVNVVGRIEEYLNNNSNTYIEASLLKFNDIFNQDGADNDLCMEINTQLNNGVYIVKEE